MKWGCVDVGGPLEGRQEGHCCLVSRKLRGVVRLCHVFIFGSDNLQSVFPQGTSRDALVQTFAIFALSFLLRPIGAVLWGCWGDKYGRRWSLSVSILMMAVASFLIGCLPSFAVAGAFAPIGLLVCRMVQGFSASGEYAGAATFLAEYAPACRRGCYVSIVPASTAAGLLMGCLLYTSPSPRDVEESRMPSSA